MVKYFLTLFLTISSFLIAAEFTASVNHNSVHTGENFTLTLTLKDASTRAHPNLDLLSKDFIIHTQQQSYNTVVVNGQFSSTTNWKISLTPRHEGQLNIPSISLETSKGQLSTQPIPLTILKNSDNPSSPSLKLTTETSQPSPYKNESFIYTIRLTSSESLAQVHMQKFEITDALVEPYGEPKAEERTTNGLKQVVVEFHFLITPLKSGPLTIPSAIIQGGVISEHPSPRRSLFDDDFDPFVMMSGFQRSQPFTLSTTPLTLEIQPAVTSVNPWLPARLLTVDELWDSTQPLKVGEPITRGFKIIAEGIKSEQLPSLKDLQSDNGYFKVYADKPKLEDFMKNGTVISQRTENYTLIPQKPGELLLPEIAITWWDTKQKQKMVARVPSRTLLIESEAKPILSSPIAFNEDIQTPSMVNTPIVPQAHSLLYLLVLILSILLTIAIIWCFLLQKKLSRLTTIPAKNEPKKDLQIEKTLVNDWKAREESFKPPANTKNKKDKLPDLNPT